MKLLLPLLCRFSTACLRPPDNSQFMGTPLWFETSLAYRAAFVYSAFKLRLVTHFGLAEAGQLKLDFLSPMNVWGDL